jgi:benzoyl-CoA reductase/2-hydroxyglutaryl-CoA dehydratase subunit BcrC/BadD/HgdB
LDFLAGVVFPHTCDSIQRLSDIWRLNVQTDFFADVVMPVKLDTDSAREYMEAVLRKFKGDLETGLGVNISDDDLKKASSEFNRIRRALRTVYQLRSEDPCLIRGRDVYTLVKSSMIMDRGVLADKLEYLIPAVRGGAGYWNAAGRKRLLLAGGICDHPEIYDLLEEAGGVVIYDDLCTGSRSFEADVTEEGDPLAALARRYLKRPACPAKHVSNTARGERLVDLARQHKADGVVFLQLKFCDPHAFDYPYLKEYLDKAGVPSFLYEIEDRLPGEGQLLTRFETFMQMI